MNAVALDTLRIAKRLRDAGFSEAQAESVTDSIREGVTGGDLATKADLDSAVARLESKIAGLDTKIAQAQAETLKWMFGMMIAQGAFVVTLIRLFPGK